MANLLSSSGSDRSNRRRWSAEDVFTSVKSATYCRIQAKNWQWRQIISRLFGVGFDKAEKDIAQSKLLEHWCEHSICPGWAPGRRSGSSTWSKQNGKKRGGTTDDDRLENINRKRRGHALRAKQISTRSWPGRNVGTPGQSSVKRRKTYMLSDSVQYVYYNTNS